MAEAAEHTGSPQRAAARPWLRFPTWIALFILGLSIYLLTLPGDLRNNADTVDRFMVTHSLLHGTLEVTCGSPPADNVRLVPGRHGCYYAIYGPGQSLLMAPLYVAGRALAAVTEPTSGASGAKLAHDALTEAIFARMLDPILGALVLVLFFFLACEVGFSLSTAIILALILGIGSTVFPDVQSGQEQIQSTLAVLALTYSILRVRRSTDQMQRGKWLLAAGASAGFGIFTRYDFWLVIAAFVVVLAILAGRKSLRVSAAVGQDAGPRSSNLGRIRVPSVENILWPLVGFVPFLMVDALWNVIRFGAPWDVGQSIGNQFGTALWQGIPNLLVSPGKGLIWYLPLLWLVPFAWRRYARRSPETLFLGLGLLAASLLFYGVIKYWHGDPAWGPRYLFPTVPLLLLPLGELIERFSSFRLSAKASMLAVVGLSVAIQLAAVGVDTWRFWYHLVERRQSERIAFKWNPKTYGYYWSPDPRFSPLVYQFAAAGDVTRIAILDHNSGIAEATPRENAKCQSLSARLQGRPDVPPGLVERFDQCVKDGLALRPLNTVSSIWLSDRYQFEDAGPFPLGLIWRVVIVSALGALALMSAAILHLQFWSSRSLDLVKRRRRTKALPAVPA